MHLIGFIIRILHSVVCSWICVNIYCTVHKCKTHNIHSGCILPTKSFFYVLHKLLIAAEFKICYFYEKYSFPPPLPLSSPCFLHVALILREIGCRSSRCRRCFGWGDRNLKMTPKFNASGNLIFILREKHFGCFVKHVLHSPLNEAHTFVFSVCNGCV